MVVSKEQEYEFWPDNIAKELIAKWKTKKQVIVTGTSMSGDPHIGNANDVIRGDAIRLAVKDMKKPVSLVWISDDMDPFRSVPDGLPKELENYLGIPASNIPDFWKCHASFTVHFEEKFLKQLEAVNVKPKILLGIEMYKKGMYNDVIKIALGEKIQIANTVNKFRTTPLPKDWYPIDVICKKCGKISTVKILSYNSKTAEVEYFCNPEVILLHRKNPVAGCGNKSKVSVLNGNTKLTWRVEWAARWIFLGATCEPFGKEHAASGGSWDTAKEIVKILGGRPPYPVVYEHFLVNGEKMSKSKGNVITVDDMLKYMPSSHLRYWMFQGRLTIAKDIKLSSIVPRLFDEFDKAERIYFGIESTEDEKKDNNYKRAYKLSVVSPKKKNTISASYDKLVELLKLSPKGNEVEFVLRKLKEQGYKIDSVELEKRLEYVKRWVDDFQITQKIDLALDSKEKDFIRNILIILEKDNNPDKIQSETFDAIKESGLGVGKGFKLLYNIILNSNAGPRFGQYVAEVGKDSIIKKLKGVL